MSIKLNFTSNYIVKELQNTTSLSNLQNTTPLPFKIALKVIKFTVTNKIFLFLTFSHLFILIHELGHALAYKMITRKGSIITMSPHHGIGQTIPIEEPVSISSFKIIWISLSGHLAIVIFSSIIILGIFSLTHYIAMPLALVIALRIAVCFPVIIRLLIEGFYVVSALYQSSGDFDIIKKEGGSLAVILSIALIISILVLCLIGVVFWF